MGPMNLASTSGVGLRDEQVVREQADSPPCLHPTQASPVWPPVHDPEESGLWPQLQSGTQEDRGPGLGLDTLPKTKLERPKPYRDMTKTVESYDALSPHILWHACVRTHTRLPVCAMLSCPRSQSLLHTHSCTHRYTHSMLRCPPRPIVGPAEHQQLVPGTQCWLLTWRV